MQFIELYVVEFHSINGIELYLTCAHHVLQQLRILCRNTYTSFNLVKILAQRLILIQNFLFQALTHYYNISIAEKFTFLPVLVKKDGRCEDSNFKKSSQFLLTMNFEKFRTIFLN